MVQLVAQSALPCQHCLVSIALSALPCEHCLVSNHTTVPERQMGRQQVDLVCNLSRRLTCCSVLLMWCLGLGFQADHANILVDLHTPAPNCHVNKDLLAAVHMHTLHFCTRPHAGCASCEDLSKCLALQGADRWTCWVLQERRQEKAAERERKQEERQKRLQQLEQQLQGLEQETAAAATAAAGGGTQAGDQLGDEQKPDLDPAETPGDRSGAEDDDDDDDEDNADQNGESALSADPCVPVH